MNNGCETAIVRTGWGLCHYFLVGICGLCSLAEAFANLTALVVTPLLACDLKFQKKDIIVLNAILPLGMAFGGFFFGSLADNNGRKCFIPITMIIIFCSSICLSFAQNFVPINFAIFLLGVGTAGNNIILRIYLMECLPPKRRGTCLVLLDLLWMLGYLAAFGVAWSLVPSVIRLLSNEFRPSSWRVLAGLGGAPSFVMACATGLLPSSPRHLLYKRNPEKALAVLQQMYAINHSQHADHYPPCQLEGCVHPDENDDTEALGSFFVAIQKYGWKTLKRVDTVFRSPYIGITILSMISRILLFPGLVWLAMWKSHISHHVYNLIREPSPSVYDLSMCSFDSGDIIKAFLRNCQGANNSRFEFFMLLSMSYLVGEGLLFFATSGMIGGTSNLALVFATRHSAQIILSVLFLAAYTILYTTVGIMILENYPTSVRGTVVGLITALPHLVAFFVEFFGRVYCTQSMYVTAGLIIGATVAALPIPDLARAPIKE